MTSKNKNPHCVYSELPTQVKAALNVRDQPDLLRICRQGNGPMYFRLGSQRMTPATWRKCDWLEFAISRWTGLRDDLIQDLRDAGFELDTANTVTPKSKTKKPKAKKNSMVRS